MIKLIVAGKRDYEDRQYLIDQLDRWISFFGEPLVVIHGAAPGADTMAHNWAVSKGYDIEQFPANWTLHGKKAGPVRNAQMAEYGDMLIAFWDGFSNGTGDMIKQMKRRGKPVIIVDITDTGIPEVFNTSWKYDSKERVFKWTNCSGEWHFRWERDKNDRIIECWYNVTDERIESLCREQALQAIMGYEITQRLPKGAEAVRNYAAYDGCHSSVLFFKNIGSNELNKIAYLVTPSDIISVGAIK